MNDNLFSLDETIRGSELIMDILQEDFTKSSDTFTSEDLNDWEYAMQHERSVQQYLIMLRDLINTKPDNG